MPPPTGDTSGIADDETIERVPWTTRARRLERLTNVWTVGAGTLFVCMLASAVRGPDANWDFLNYHYYNSRAIVTGSFVDDVAPGGIQTYLNPVVDIPIHLFVVVFGTWWGMVLWAGALQWLCYVPVWRLTGVIDPLRHSTTRRVVAFGVAASASGAASVAFTTFGDWAVAALVCEAVVRVVRAFDVGAPQPRSLAFAGVFIGLAVGVKMTSATFALAIAAGLLVVAGVRSVVWLTAGALATFAVFSGPWMLYLVLRFGSPVFPFYNDIFRSSSGPETNFDDPRYGAVSPLDLVSFPIDMLRGGVRYSELAMRDWRFAALLAAIVVVALRAPNASFDRWYANRQARFFATFLAVGGLTWVVVFGIYRYFLAAEIVTSLLLVALVAEMIRSERRLVVIAIAAIGLVVPYQELPPWGRGDALANPQLEAIIASEPVPPRFVVFAGNPPFGHLTAPFPSTTRFASLASFPGGYLTYDGPLAEDLDRFVERGLAEGSLVAILQPATPTMPAPLERLTLSECRPFSSLTQTFEFCRLSDPGAD